jgi:hypothetical protein
MHLGCADTTTSSHPPNSIARHSGLKDKTTHGENEKLRTFLGLSKRI